MRLIKQHFCLRRHSSVAAATFENGKGDFELNFRTSLLWIGRSRATPRGGFVNAVSERVAGAGWSRRRGIMSTRQQQHCAYWLCSWLVQKRCHAYWKLLNDRCYNSRKDGQHFYDLMIIGSCGMHELQYYDNYVSIIIKNIEKIYKYL